MRFDIWLRSIAAALARRVSPRSARGASAVEYGLLVVFIAAAIVGTVAILGGNTKAQLKYPTP